MKLPFNSCYRFPVYSYHELAVLQPPDDLPERVYIKTRTQTFCRLYYFALRQGRIWFKPNEESTGIVEPWSLFPPIGLPTDDTGSPDFEEPEQIVEITADADELIVRSSWNHFYLMRFENQDPFVGDFWRDGDGVPAGRLWLKLRHRHNRGYALGRRNHDVLYWQDPAGNPHHWGSAGISTLYVLSESGQEINIFDTGLPADFSRQIGGPCRGHFIAESISASASTVFVIDKYGNMHTRLADFDTMGTNPMFFTYAYHDSFRPQDRGTDPKTIFNTMCLPSEDWRRQPRIPLRGQACISRDITNLQTGHGNAARELRVAGTDAEGNTGYYWKPILDSEWSFQKTPDRLDESRLLAPTDLSQDKENLGPDQNIPYLGKITLGGRSFAVELPDFNRACNPSLLRIHVGEKNLDLYLNSLDMWTWMTRDDPGRDGTPRVYLAALEIPRGIEQTQDQEIQDLLDHYFRRRNLEPDAYVMRVSTDYLEMYARHPQDGVSISCVRAGTSYATPDEARAGEVRIVDGFLEQANDKSLMVDNLEALLASPPHIQYLEQKIRLNAYVAKRLAQIMKLRQNSLRLQRALAYTVSAVNVITILTLIAFLPRVRNLSRIVGTLVHAYADSSKLALRASEPEYHAAQKILLDRQTAYQAKLDSLTRALRTRDHT
jgi:hypothetical protein